MGVPRLEAEGRLLDVGLTCTSGLQLIGVKCTAEAAFPTLDGTSNTALPVTGNSCRTQATKNGFQPDPTKVARLQYSGNQFEGFFSLPDNANFAFTAYPFGLFSGKYYRLKALIAGVDAVQQNGGTGDQFWAFPGPAGGTPVPNVGHVPLPAVPAE